MSTSTGVYTRTTLEMLFDGIKTSIECSPVKFVVFESKTGPMRTLTSKHKPFVNLDHCEVVCSLHTSVDPSFNCSSKVWSRSFGLCAHFC